MPLTTVPFGPWVKGVIDTANPSLQPNGTLRRATNLYFNGLFELAVRPGTITQLTLLDDAETPAEVTSVIVSGVPFLDGALAVGYSSETETCYLYRLNATMDGWYDSEGTLTEDATEAEPVGVLWDSMSAAPDVMIAEGLGVAYIANTGAADELGLYWPTKTYTDFDTIDTLTVNGTGGTAGTDEAYFSGVCAFNQHLWAWGYGAGSTAGYTSYRPELARFSQPNFEPFQSVDSITLGDRVRSLRDRVIAGAAVGNALILAGGSLLTRITGEGRDSWYKTQIDKSYGIVGPKAFVVAGETLYYWSPQGPMRITDSSAPDPLWDAIPAAVASVANTAQMVGAFDLERNQVLFFYSTGDGVRTFCAFDVRRNVWLGPDADIGLTLYSAGSVAPLFRSTTSAPIGPSAAPTVVSTTSIGNTTALATWSVGDALSQVEVSYKKQSESTYTVLPALAAGTTTYTFSGLTPGVAYEWRVRHVRNGQYSSYSGPSSLTQFTTSTVTLLPPTNFDMGQVLSPDQTCIASWTNSGEAGVSTQVWIKLVASSTYYPAGTAAPGQTSLSLSLGYGSYNAKAKHIRDGSIASEFTSAVTFTVSSSV